MIFIGLALADSMFNGDCVITRNAVGVEEVRAILADGYSSCCNPSHQATLTALKSRYGLDLVVPETPPKVSLNTGDRVVVLSVRGLPRLTDRHEYTEAEVASATFAFSVYSVA